MSGMNSPRTPRYLASGFFQSRSNIPGTEPSPYCPPCRPTPHSIHMSGMPTRMNAMKYGIMNVPPPFCVSWLGKRRKFPRPTALPAMARIRPIREPHCSRGLAVSVIGVRVECGQVNGQRSTVDRRPSCAVIRCFPRNRHIMRVRLAEAGGGDLHELHIAPKCLDITHAAVAHPAPEPAHHLEKDVGDRAPVRHPSLDALRHHLGRCQLAFLEVAVSRAILHGGKAPHP